MVLDNFKEVDKLLKEKGRVFDFFFMYGVLRQKVGFDFEIDLVKKCDVQ